MTKYWLWNKGDFIKLHDKEVFSKVKPVFDTVQWENGLEIAPEELYSDSNRVNQQSIQYLQQAQLCFVTFSGVILSMMERVVNAI